MADFFCIARAAAAHQHRKLRRFCCTVIERLQLRHLLLSVVELHFYEFVNYKQLISLAKVRSNLQIAKKNQPL